MECLDKNRGKFSACRGLEHKLDSCFDGAKAAKDDDGAKVAA